jgi:hypothetical protein
MLRRFTMKGLALLSESGRTEADRVFGEEAPIYEQKTSTHSEEVPSSC